MTHLNDVEVVLITERVQNGGHCALRDGEPLPCHAAACVQQYDDVLWCAGCLDVPGTNTDWHDVPANAKVRSGAYRYSVGTCYSNLHQLPVMMSMVTYFILQVRTEACVNQGKNGERIPSK